MDFISEMMKVYDHIEKAYELMDEIMDEFIEEKWHKTINKLFDSVNEPVEQIDETMKKELVIEKSDGTKLELKPVEHTGGRTASSNQIKPKQKQSNPQSRYYMKKRDEILQKQKEKYKSDEEKKKKKEYYKQHKEELKAKQKERYNKLKNKSDTNIYKPEDGNKTVD